MNDTQALLDDHQE